MKFQTAFKKALLALTFVAILIILLLSKQSVNPVYPVSEVNYEITRYLGILIISIMIAVTLIDDIIYLLQGLRSCLVAILLVAMIALGLFAASALSTKKHFKKSVKKVKKMRKKCRDGTDDIFEWEPSLL